MRESDNRLVVRNIEQAAAWLELDGQISDGHWENASPNDHWKPWCHAKVLVAAGGQQLGRNFVARKVNYNFTSSELLEVVGLRMLGIVRIARALGMKAATLHEHDVDTDGTVEYPKHVGEFWDKVRDRIDSTGLAKLQAAVADESYTMKDLLRDLRDLKKIVRQFRA